MMMLLGYVDELGRDVDSLLMLNALLVVPFVEGTNRVDCASKAVGSSFSASS